MLDRSLESRRASGLGPFGTMSDAGIDSRRLAGSPSKMRWFWGAVALGLMPVAQGCGSDVGTLLVPPDWVTTGTALAAVEGPKGGRLLAFRSDEPLFLAAETGEFITLLEYDATRVAPPIPLGEVGSAPGSGCALGREHPPRRAFSTRVTEEGLGESGWSVLEPSQLSPFVRDFELQLGGECRDACQDWEVSSFVLPGAQQNPAWGVWLEAANEALFGTYGEDTYAVSPEGEVRVIERVPRDRITSANLPPGGELWLGGHGRVYVGTFDGSTLAIEPRLFRPDSVPFAFLSATTSSAGRGLVGLTDQGHLLRHDGRDFTALTESLSPFDDAGAQLSRRGGISRLGPDEVVVVWSQDRLVLRYLDGQLLDETPDGLDEAGGGIASVEGLGTVFGTSATGQVYVHGGASWMALSDPLGLQVRRIQALSDGFMIGASRGTIRQYIVGHGFCPEQIVLSSDIREIVKIDDDRLIVVGNRSAAGGNQAIGAVLRRQPPD